MAEKIINSRFVQKHGTEATWQAVSNFIPKPGEIIIYDKDALHESARMKIGDGSTLLQYLPFISDDTIPDWAKEPTKPTYTAQEVGALPADTQIPSIEGLVTEEYVNTELAKKADATAVNSELEKKADAGVVSDYLNTHSGKSVTLANVTSSPLSIKSNFGSTPDGNGYTALHLVANSAGECLFGGLTLGQAIYDRIGNHNASKESYTTSIDYSAGTVKFSARQDPEGDNVSYNNTVIYEGPFKSNTAYTLFLRGKSSSTSGASNLRFVYLKADGTKESVAISNFDTNKISNIISVSDPNKTLISIVAHNNADNVTLYYNMCGLFEGEHTAEEFIAHRVEFENPVSNGSYNWNTGSGETSIRVQNGTVEETVALTALRWSLVTESNLEGCCVISADLGLDYTQVYSLSSRVVVDSTNSDHELMTVNKIMLRDGVLYFTIPDVDTAETDLGDYLYTSLDNPTITLTGYSYITEPMPVRSLYGPVEVISRVNTEYYCTEGDLEVRQLYTTEIDQTLTKPGIAADSYETGYRLAMCAQGYNANYFINSPGWKRIAILIRGNSGHLDMCLAANRATTGRFVQNVLLAYSGYTKWPDAAREDINIIDYEGKPCLYQILNHTFGADPVIYSDNTAYIDKVRIAYPKYYTTGITQDSASEYTNPVNIYMDIHITGGSEDFWANVANYPISFNMNFVGHTLNHRCYPITEQTDCQVDADGNVLGEFGGVLCDTYELALKKNSGMLVPDSSEFAELNANKLSSKRRIDYSIGNAGITEKIDKMRSIDFPYTSATGTDLAVKLLRTNLITNHQTANTGTSKGVTYTQYKNGIFRLTGTPTAAAQFTLLNYSDGKNIKEITPMVLKKGVSYTVRDCRLEVMDYDKYFETWLGTNPLGKAAVAYEDYNGDLEKVINIYPDSTSKGNMKATRTVCFNDSDKIVLRVSIYFTKTSEVDGVCLYPQVCRDPSNIIIVPNTEKPNSITTRHYPYSTGEYVCLNLGAEYIYINFIGKFITSSAAGSSYDAYEDLHNLFNEDFSDIDDIQGYQREHSSGYVLPVTGVAAYDSFVRVPNVYSGTSEPSYDLGEIGDIFIVYAPPTTISFTIGDGEGTTLASCEAEEGMTWGQWVNSSYNTFGSVVSGGNICFNGTMFVVDPEEYDLVSEADAIIEGTEYYGEPN